MYEVTTKECVRHNLMVAPIEEKIEAGKLRWLGCLHGISKQPLRVTSSQTRRRQPIKTCNEVVS